MMSKTVNVGQNINKKTLTLNDTFIPGGLIDVYRTSIQKQQNTHSFQVHMECSPKQITC